MLTWYSDPQSSYGLPEPRKEYKTLGPKTKWWITSLRRVQLGFRVLQLVAAFGILFLFIVINKVDSLPSWVLRITVRITPPLPDGSLP